MTKAVLSIGSNIKPEYHVRQAVAHLIEAFSLVRLSPVYESRAVGFAGDNFLNFVALIDTEHTLVELQSWCKALEVANGRDLNAAKFTSRTLDIDILLYGDCVQEAHPERGIPQLPRAEITQNAFVLKPLADLLPHWKHPQLAQSYAQMWQAFAAKPQPDEQTLWPVAMDWTENQAN